MMRSALIWLVLAIFAGTGLFVVKHEVLDLEDKLAALDGRIAQDREAIHVLRAEWAYLTQPERLAALAARHLGLRPPATDQIADTVDRLGPPALPPEAPAPEGDDGEPPRATMATMKSAP